MTRMVRALNLRYGDVAEHPDTHQLGQVTSLHLLPSDVHVLTLSGCHWHLSPSTLLTVHHRIVEDDG